MFWRIMKAILNPLGLELRKRAKFYNPKASKRFILGRLISAHLLRLNEKIYVIDGGCGLEAGSYGSIDSLENDILFTYGFDVDSKEVDRLNDEANKNNIGRRVFPVGLWSKKGNIPIYFTKSPGGTSAYIPNIGLTKRWQYGNGDNLGEMLKIESTHNVKVDTLDNWKNDNNIMAVDFIKLNIQGSEFEVLKGSISILDEVVGLQVELSFEDTYLEAPKFADIDPYLRKNGFIFFGMLSGNYVARRDSPVKFPLIPSGDWHWPARQLFEGHFVYFRDPIRSKSKISTSPLKILKLAILAELYGQIEYAFELLFWLSKNLDNENSIDVEAIDEIIAIGKDQYLDLISK